MPPIASGGVSDLIALLSVERGPSNATYREDGIVGPEYEPAACNRVIDR